MLLLMHHLGSKYIVWDKAATIRFLAPGRSMVYADIRLNAMEVDTIRELADLVIELTGSPSRIDHRPLPTDDPVQRKPDISRATQYLGWTPRIQLREGLSHTIAYFENLLSRGRDRQVAEPRPKEAIIVPAAAATPVPAGDHVNGLGQFGLP